MRHLSPRQLELLPSFGGCAQRWAREYLGPKRPDKPTGAQSRGRLFHSGLEAHFKAQLADGGKMPGPEVGLIQIERFEKMKPEDREIVKGLFLAYYAELAPSVVPTHVEHFFSLPIPGRMGWDFRGRIDLIDQNDYVIDAKSSWAPWDEAQARQGAQRVAYSYAVAKLSGQLPSGFIYQVVTLPGFKSGGLTVCQEFVLDTSKEELEEFEVVLREAVDFVEAGQFPRDLSQNCRSCPFVGECRPHIAVGRKK